MRVARGARSATAKRALDLGLTIASLPVAVPLCVASAAAILLNDDGPVLFRQVRVGKNGVPFTLLKFRTMTHGIVPNPIVPDRSRITRVGAFLRRTSLDELPQLANVVRGEMSLVGPRPALQYQVARYTAAQRGRLAVPPGLTGLAQIAGRNSLSWAERIEYDLEYCRRRSVWLDVRIIGLTFGAVLGGRGVEGHRADDPIAMSAGSGRNFRP